MPDHQGALHNLGVICTVQGRLSQAVEWYERALKGVPDAADIHSNIGVVFKELGNSARAMHHLSAAIRLQPDYAAAHNNLGALLMAMNDPEAAYGHFRRAAELEPDDAVAWANAGFALLLSRGPASALEPLQRAAALAPEMQDVRVALGGALFVLERFPEAIRLLERSLEVEPGRVELLADLVHARQHICDWTGLQEDATVIRKHVAAAEGWGGSPFFFMMLPGTTVSEQRLCAEKYVQRQLDGVIRRRPAMGFVFERKPGRRLRIGYLTAHFHDHPTMYSIAGVLEQHDRTRFETVGFSCGPDSRDAMRARARAALDDFVDLRALSDEEAARAIHARGIDILVDLKGYTRGARPAILALRPAPVQAGYLVYPGTLGGDILDCYVADSYVVPPAGAAGFSERIVYLASGYQCNDNQRVQPDAPARAACGLPEAGFVFCSFNQTYKITPEMFDIWCRLLREVPGSVLWLWASNPYAPERLRREAETRGVASGRLVFAQTLLPSEKHRARIPLADLVLDTLPCNAHSTGSDALWAGVPIVTCSGETFVSRVTGSNLRAAGLPELVTTSLAEYEALALRLARDPAALTALRRRLAANRATAPLFDTARQTRDLEAVYEDIWRGYLEQRKV